MKILLVNANPVVGKLVTLSAQKTGDELTSVSSIDEVPAQSYDLLLVDDNSYTQELFEALNAKASFSQSCFIGSRTSVKPEVFSREFNKPFLPTDLVDIFMGISSSINAEPAEEAAAVEEESLEEDFAPVPKPDVMEDEFEFDEVMPGFGEDEEDILSSLDDDDLFTNLETIEDEEDYDASVHVLDEDDVKEVQGLLDETDEDENAEVSEDFTDKLPPYSADEKTLEEISAALDELDEENDDAFLLDDALSEDEAEKGLEGMEDLEEDIEELFEGLEMEEELENAAPVQSAAISEALPEELEEDAGAEDTDDLLETEEKNTDTEEISDDELFKSFNDEELDEDDFSAMPEELEESVPEEEAAIAEDTLELDEELDDEEAFLDTPDAENERDDAEGSEQMQADLNEEAEDLLGVEEISDEELAKMFDETQSMDEAIASRPSMNDELSENLGEEELDEDDLSALLESLDTLEAEDDGFAPLEESEESVPGEKAATGEDQIPDEALADMLDENEEAVDLDALNEEIEAALDNLDEEDLLSELNESDLEGFKDDFSSISANALKRALGEEILEELEEDEEELEIQEALNALDFMDEEEEDEPELLVGQSEFASLHEEALNEAMDDLDDIQGDHPELDEIDAFVDQVPVGGDALAAFSDASSGNESIAVLEKLIATLKQKNVQEALNGMKMNITISFGENEI